MILFRILVAIDALAAAVILYFFLEGLREGSVSSENAAIWLALLLWPAATLGSAFLLRAQGRLRAATLALLLLAGPALLLALLLLMFLILRPDFR